MWTDFLKNTVLKPGLERLGTIGAGWLLLGGDWMCTNWDACGLVTAGGAQEVAKYVVAVALLFLDIAVIHLNRKGKR